MTLHIAFFEPDTDQQVLFQEEAWEQTTILKKTCEPGSIFLTVEFTTEHPLDADGKEDFYGMSDYCTGLFNADEVNEEVF